MTMKISLVVASGVHEGKVIPITVDPFLIGRDPQCQLRPASQAVSKQHCAIRIRENQVFLQDFGSTNGTVVNEKVLRDSERAISHNDRVKVGPLDFMIRIESTAVHKALGSTPSEAIRRKSEEALASVKAVAETATASALVGATPARMTPAPKPAAKPAPPKPPARKPMGEPSNDEIAAMLLGLSDDDSSDKVPDGSTVMEAPILPPGDAPPPSTLQSGSTKHVPAKAASREETSSAASEILRKMLRRPR